MKPSSDCITDQDLFLPFLKKAGKNQGVKTNKGISVILIHF